MIHGPDASELRTAARKAVMDHCVALAESDGVPATQRAMYVLKLAEAQALLKDATPSRMIAEEAAMRGVSPEQLAGLIVQMAEASVDLELLRTRINLEIDASADDVEAIMAVLDRCSVTLTF